MSIDLTKFPTATSTGPRTHVALKDGSKLTLKPSLLSGTTNYDGYAFKGQITLALWAWQTVTFTNCTFDAGGASYNFNLSNNSGKVVIDGCEPSNVASAFIYGKNFVIQHSYCHKSGGDGFKPTKNATIDSNYVTDLGRSVGAHADGVQLRGATDVKITNNTFDQAKDQRCNRGIMAQIAGLARILVVGNLFRGKGDYAIQIFDSTQPKTITVSNNVFQKPGPKPKHVQSGVLWSGNQYEDGSPAN